VAVPAYNEAGNLARVVTGIVTHLRGRFPFEVVVVDDGSRDATAEVLADLTRRHPEVRAIRHAVNRGYGGALRSGFAASRGAVVCLYPGDGQFDFAEVDLLLPLLDRADIVAPYRERRSDPFIRKVNEVLYNLLIRLLFDLRVRDIDCGFKLYRGDVLRSIPLESDGALIDAELLVKARRRGHVIVQRGVTHRPRLEGQQTGANLAVILRMFRELARFYLLLRRGGTRA
jgi:glycosyltransferase involved in cell wall biosynthesis